MSGGPSVPAAILAYYLDPLPAKIASFRRQWRGSENVGSSGVSKLHIRQNAGRCDGRRRRCQ
jgi:hypothetical protein